MLIRVCISKRISNTRNVFDILKAVLTFICLQKCPTSPNIKTWELTISAECLLRFGNHNQKIIAVSELRCTITKFPNEPLLENYRQKKDKFGIATFVSSKFPSNHFCKVLFFRPSRVSEMNVVRKLYPRRKINHIGCSNQHCRLWLPNPWQGLYVNDCVRNRKHVLCFYRFSV